MLRSGQGIRTAVPKTKSFQQSSRRRTRYNNHPEDPLFASCPLQEELAVLSCLPKVCLIPDVIYDYDF